MKILYFSQRYSLHDYNFLRKMAESRHSIFFLPIEIQNQFNDKRSLPRGVQLIEWKEKYDFISSTEALIFRMQEFEDIIEEINPDLIHAGPVQTCGFMTALSSFHPFLLMSWGSDILLNPDTKQSLYWITKFTLGQSDWLFVDNQAVRKKAQSIIPYNDGNILEFPWGIDLNYFNNNERRENIEKQVDWDGYQILLSVRMWEPIYGILDLLEGFYLAYQENQNIRLILLGDGSLSASVHEYITENGISDLIIMPGIINHNDMKKYYNISDIYVSCSFSDGSSISLLEAMASGLIPVVTNIPGNLQWIRNHENGWLISAGNSRDIACGICSAVNANEYMINSFRQSNIEQIQKKADWNKNFSKLLDLYDHIEEKYA